MTDNDKIKSTMVDLITKIEERTNDIIKNFRKRFDYPNITIEPTPDDILELKTSIETDMVINMCLAYWIKLHNICKPEIFITKDMIVDGLWLQNDTAKK